MELGEKKKVELRKGGQIHVCRILTSTVGEMNTIERFLAKE
jgi:hypothetical protein